MKEVTKELWQDSEVAVARLLSLPADSMTESQVDYLSCEQQRALHGELWICLRRIPSGFVLAPFKMIILMGKTTSFVNPSIENTMLEKPLWAMPVSGQS